MRIGRLAVWMLLLVVLASAGCTRWWFEEDMILIVNQTDEKVRVVTQVRGVENVVQPTLGPGSHIRLRGDCINAELIAQSSVTLEEVDHRAPPFCRGDDPWIIDGVDG